MKINKNRFLAGAMALLIGCSTLFNAGVTVSAAETSDGVTVETSIQETEEVRYTTMKDMREEESSAVIRARVKQVHEIQRERFRGRRYRFNSQMNMEDLEKYCVLDAESAERMQEKYEEYHLSARTYGKILKTARTIADLAGAEHIQWGHLEEAFVFRNPDKNYWRRD